MGSFEVGFKIFHGFPFFNDGDDIFIENLRRKPCVDVDSRAVLDTTFFLQNIRDIGFEDFQERILFPGFSRKITPLSLKIFESRPMSPWSNRGISISSK